MRDTQNDVKKKEEYQSCIYKINANNYKELIKAMFSLLEILFWVVHSIVASKTEATPLHVRKVKPVLNV